MTGNGSPAERDRGDVEPDAVRPSQPPAGVHIEDTKNIDGQWRVAGTSGLVLVVTGKGETMQGAQEQCYERLDSVVIPNVDYRDDIGDRWIGGDDDRLHAWGYLGPA